MSPTKLRRWSWIHKWSSLVCTVFMLLLCLTGLPLIYHHEIGHLLGTDVEAPALPAAMAANPPRGNIDAVLASAQALYPAKIPMYMSQEADEPAIWNVTLGDHPNDEHYKPIAVDARTTQVITEPAFEGGVFMSTMFRLHVDLFAGLYGKLFLGFMGLLLIVAVVSGVVLYAPFMRKLDFGSVRQERSKVIKWLDLHNLLGIVTLVWVFVVGATGMVNTWADLLLKYWQATEVAEMLKPYEGQPPVKQTASIHDAILRAEAAEPGMKVGFVAFPGTPFSSSHHYGIFMRGDEAFSSRLYKPVLIDAATGEITDRRELPWYLTALLLSQPLHFGDYGGQPMKLLWALLDIGTMIVLGSGLYLWFKRGRAAKKTVKEARAAAHDAPALARSTEAS
ncbi:PepSY-associated TM helix domain-containing protein [Telluria aromaticivorans]|uniref:PepSY domain-containing protein n=1 Tax=Telluria aromaticivorans TaxID=2725995 RepID=A0A7Y2JVD8_9BURK|nr:PepSY domain-containing protein [Telluria aromaticivorans]NNG21742.1 PepSY domain-containing protein [Telluria aromaticivorans]